MLNHYFILFFFLYNRYNEFGGAQHEQYERFLFSSLYFKWKASEVFIININFNMVCAFFLTVSVNAYMLSVFNSIGESTGTLYK